MSENHHDNRERAKRIAELAESDPQAAIQHLDEIGEFLTDSEVGTRRLAATAVNRLSISRPVALRASVDPLIARLDDEDVEVRIRLLQAFANLAQWFPQDLEPATDLIVASLDAENESERMGAAGPISEIAYFRPDIVTPRREALYQLKQLADTTSFRDSEGYSYADPEKVEQAIQALKGGDMASRPLEDDLPPAGNHAKLSSPARVGVTSALWIPMMVLSVFSYMWYTIKMMIRYRNYTPRVRAKVMFRHITHLTFLTNIRRARLYLRSSIHVTPTQVLPFTATTAPEQEDPGANSPPYPDDWGEVTRLVLQRDGFECRCCGALGGPRGNSELHVDHQIPRSVGGADEPNNLRTLCKTCHQARHARKFD
jgi:hypothetical protein